MLIIEHIIVPILALPNPGIMSLPMDVILLPSNSVVNFLENKILRKQVLL